MIQETDDALSQTLEDIRALVARGGVRISVHGYEELAADQVSVHEVVNGLADAVLVEDYPEFPKGSCVLVLEQDTAGKRYTSSGAFPRGRHLPQFWSPPIGQIRQNGMRRGEREKHEHQGS